MTNVLKRIISALIIISSVIQISGFNLAYAAGEEYKDPYKTIYLSEYDGEDSYLPANFSYRDGFGSNTQGGHYVSWKNVKFDKTPVSVKVSYGTLHSGATAEIRLDSMLGPVLATISPDPTGNMFTEGIVEVNVQQEVTGVHDLYFIWKNSYLNIKYIKFSKYGEDNLGYSIFEGMSEDAVYEDLSANALSYEIKLLNKLGMLGFIQETKFDGKKEVTKADFAQALCGLYTDKVENDETYFYDLPALHTKAKYVNYIYEKGLFEMTPDKHFRPDDVITVEQAFEIIKKLYKFPDSDDSVIEQTKKNLEQTILSGITGKMSAKLTRQNLAKMLSNTIEATYIKYKTGANGKIEHYFTEGILKETRNLDKISGLVGAVPSTSLSNVESGLEKGKVLIGDIVYDDPKGLAQQYLGYNCVVFYEKVGGELNVEAIYPKKTVSETIINTTKNDELLTISEDLIEYYYPNKKGKTNKIKLEKTVYFVYNGKAIDDTIDRFVNPDTFQGKIRIINNKNCIAVLIDEYQNVILKSVDSQHSKYLDRLTDKQLDFTEDNLTVYYNQRPITNSSIPEDSAAYIYQSKNTVGQKITRIIILPDNKVTGTVKSVKNDIIKIDSKEYKIAKENPNIYTVGLYRTFVINTYNEIVWSDIEVTNELSIGIFLGYRTSDAEEKAAVKLYTNDGTIKTFECAERFILDGLLRKKIYQIETGMHNCKGLADVEEKTPVMYFINDDNKLAILDTYHEGLKTKYDNLVRIAVKDEQAGQKYRFSTRSRILVKQESNNGYGAVPFETNFTLISLWKGIDEAYNIIEPFTNQIIVTNTIEGQAYSTKGNNKIADLLVCTSQTMNTVPKITDFLLVDEVIETLDNDGVPARAIMGYTGADKVTKFISHQLSGEKLAEIKKIFDNLKRGDYIYVTYDHANNISDIQVNYFCDGVEKRNDIKSVLYKKDSGGIYRDNTNKSASLDGIRIYCKVTDIEDNFMFVEIDDGNGKKIEEVYAISSPAISKVYSRGIETGLSINEVFNSKTEHGANAVVLLAEGHATQIVIYE